MSTTDRRNKLSQLFHDVCLTSHQCVTLHDDDIDELIREPEELINFGALCQRMSGIAYELASTDEVTEDTLSFVRGARRSERDERVRKWLWKLENSLGNKMYQQEHQQQQSLGDYTTA